MVQIILAENRRKILALQLYIPHGSDNTKTQSARDRLVFALYIPHGSDNTCFCRNDACFRKYFISHMVQIILFTTRALPLCVLGLYIPHGSDNTRK